MQPDPELQARQDEADRQWQALIQGGNVDFREGRLALARSKYLDAMQVLRGCSGQRSSDGMALRMRLAAVHIQLGRYQDALSDYKAVFRSLEVEGARSSIEAAGLRMKTASLHEKMGQPKRAMRDYLLANKKYNLLASAAFACFCSHLPAPHARVTK